MNYFLDHIPALVSLLVTIYLASKVQKIHLDINSRLDQWREDTHKAGIAEGKLAGQKDRETSARAEGKIEGAEENEKKRSQKL